MLVFDDNSKPLILDSIHTPTVADSIWVLDLELMDFTLAPLLVLEETVAPTIEILILGFYFPIPANWNILVVDSETSQLDVVEVSELAGREFSAFIYGANCPRYDMSTISVADYHPNFSNISPSLFKHQMLCHPINDTQWVCVAPADTYNKYLKEKIAGDIL